jgi:hypothetical protein
MNDDVTRNLKDGLLSSLDFLISLEDENNMNHLNLLKEQGIIDIESLKKFDYIIPRAKSLKNGFEFILFDSPLQSPQISKCVEAIQELKNYLFYSDMVYSKIIIIIHTIFSVLPFIQLNDHKGNLNNFIYARN